MVRLICIDADGTLLGTGDRVAKRVWIAAAHAAEAGIQLALCTGRPAFGVTRTFAERLAPEGWHAFQNGASLVRLSTGESRSASLPADIVTELKRRSSQTGRILGLYSDHTYAVESTSELVSQQAAILGVPFIARSFDDFTSPIVSAQWLIHEHELAAVLSEPHDGLELGPSTAPSMPGSCFVNLTSPGIDKSSAVRALAELYGCALSEVMFIGDGMNDISAMQIVGTPVAMGNAAPAVRALAKHQVVDADHGGVADALALALDQANARLRRAEPTSQGRPAATP